jgi:type I restriction-modification system DNA methylase subunit
MLRQVRRVRVLDPACGCGNFLIVSYRELRLVEQTSDRSVPCRYERGGLRGCPLDDRTSE